MASDRNTTILRRSTRLATEDATADFKDFADTLPKPIDIGTASGTNSGINGGTASRNSIASSTASSYSGPSIFSVPSGAASVMDAEEHPTADAFDSLKMTEASFGGLAQAVEHDEVAEPGTKTKPEKKDKDDKDDKDDDEEVPGPPGPPVNFGTVLPGMFRSSYPKPENFDFLKGLRLKTIVTLVDKNHTEEYGNFMSENGITHHIISMKGTKKEAIPVETMRAILDIVLDRSKFPLLIHCNQGRHRTGCVVGILRAIAGWERGRVTDEYCAYAVPKIRDCDVDYIRAFELGDLDTLLAQDDRAIPQLLADGVALAPKAQQHLTEQLAEHAEQQRLAQEQKKDHDTPRTVVGKVGFRVHSFVRSTFVSVTVLAIWLWSGARMRTDNASDRPANTLASDY